MPYVIGRDMPYVIGPNMPYVIGRDVPYVIGRVYAFPILSILNNPSGIKGYIYTRSVRKVSDRIFLCEHLMDYNLARLHEPTLNLSAHA